MKPTAFKIESVNLFECDFKHLPMDEPDDEVYNENPFNVSVEETTESNKFKVLLSFDQHYKGKTTGELKIKVVFCGNFEFNELITSALSKERFCETNAPAMIFPYLREFIASITGRAGLPPLLLPPLSFVSEK